MDDDVDAADDDNEEIDYETMVQYSIKFYYTPEFAAVTPDVEGFVSQVVTEINMGYINSEVPLEAYVLCTEEAEELTEEPDARAQLFNFARMKGRGHSALAAVRDTADTAVLLVADFANSTCGIGFVAGLKAGKTLSTVKKSCAWSYYSVGHEIGHNVGLDHDPDHASALPYPYGTGHHLESNDDEEEDEEDGGYRTIMSYKKEGHKTRINYYSNPNIRFDNGALTGTDSSNNALVLLKNRFRLAAVGDESSTQCSREEETSNEAGDTSAEDGEEDSDEAAEDEADDEAEDKVDDEVEDEAGNEVEDETEHVTEEAAEDAAENSDEDIINSSNINYE